MKVRALGFQKRNKLSYDTRKRVKNIGVKVGDWMAVKRFGIVKKGALNGRDKMELGFAIVREHAFLGRRPELPTGRKHALVEVKASTVRMTKHMLARLVGIEEYLAGLVRIEEHIK
ncbi:hypothetical protein NDU88_003306 [Pleurodeles waltl]|uniref:Uncharacterized protein n=1 Tax=Pleurodeles waltl TaxID=8319 RepID=A0AAV7SDA2_PLEWA|nr:hypothetical protein NDU88_003306 [Pleurodeles waltl]